MRFERFRVHEDGDKAWQPGTGTRQQGEPGSVEVAPVQLVRALQPADLVQDIEVVAKRVDDHGSGPVGEQVGGFLVLDDQDRLGVDGQCVDFLQGCAEVSQAADSCAIGGVGQDHIDVDRQRLQPEGIQVVLFQFLVWLVGVWFVSDAEAGQDEPTVTGKPLGAHAQDWYLPDRQSGTRVLGEPSSGLEQDLEVGLFQVDDLRYERAQPFLDYAVRQGADPVPSGVRLPPVVGETHVEDDQVVNRLKVQVGDTSWAPTTVRRVTVRSLAAGCACDQLRQARIHSPTVSDSRAIACADGAARGNENEASAPSSSQSRQFLRYRARTWSVT